MIPGQTLQVQRITKHRVGLEFEFKFEFELDFELQFELILSVVTTISDTLRILQATCLTVRFISDALEHLVKKIIIIIITIIIIIIIIMMMIMIIHDRYLHLTTV